MKNWLYSSKISPNKILSSFNTLIANSTQRIQIIQNLIAKKEVTDQIDDLIIEYTTQKVTAIRKISPLTIKLDRLPSPKIKILEVPRLNNLQNKFVDSAANQVDDETYILLIDGKYHEFNLKKIKNPPKKISSILHRSTSIFLQDGNNHLPQVQNMEIESPLGNKNHLFSKNKRFRLVRKQTVNFGSLTDNDFISTSPSIPHSLTQNFDNLNKINEVSDENSIEKYDGRKIIDISKKINALNFNDQNSFLGNNDPLEEEEDGGNFLGVSTKMGGKSRLTRSFREVDDPLSIQFQKSIKVQKLSQNLKGNNFKEDKNDPFKNFELKFEEDSINNQVDHIQKLIDKNKMTKQQVTRAVYRFEEGLYELVQNIKTAIDQSFSSMASEDEKDKISSPILQATPLYGGSPTIFRSRTPILSSNAFKMSPIKIPVARKIKMDRFKNKSNTLSVSDKKSQNFLQLSPCKLQLGPESDEEPPSANNNNYIIYDNNKGRTQNFKMELDPICEDSRPSNSKENIKKLDKMLHFIDEAERLTVSDPGVSKNVSNSLFSNFQNQQMMSLEEFEFMGELGQGAYGKIFLVKRKNTSDLYAMKVLGIKKEINRSELSKILNERDVFTRLNSPFCVSALTSFVYKALIFFVMEYVPGKDLFFQVFEEEEIMFNSFILRNYLAEIVLGLKHLHQQGIIHRDIKPGNILVDKDGHLMLTDYGLSDLEKQSNKTGLEAKGSLNFMAPENFIDGEDIGQEVDWWAVAILAFFLIKERYPFEGETKEDMVKNILKNEIRWDPKSKLFICDHRNIDWGLSK